MFQTPAARRWSKLSRQLLMALMPRDATKQSRSNSQATERNRMSMRMLVITSIAMHPPSLPSRQRGDKQSSPKREPGRSSCSMSITQIATSSSLARYVLHSVTDAQLAGAMVFSGNTLLLKSYPRARSRYHCAVALQWVEIEPTALALGVHYSVF